MRRGERVFHFLWRDHTHTHRAVHFRDDVQDYIWRIWAGAVLEGREPSTRLPRAFHAPSAGFH